MGRVAHNAFVFSWIIEQIERLNKLADESEITDGNAWLLNWKTVEGEVMTIHVLIPCSKTKDIPPPKELIWTPKKGLNKWNKAWNDCSLKKAASEMYTGRIIQQQIRLCLEHKNVKLYIISAGGGLIYPLSKEIPPYEATFLQSAGPSKKEWHLLPEGGLSNLQFIC